MGVGDREQVRERAMNWGEEEAGGRVDEWKQVGRGTGGRKRGGAYSDGGVLRGREQRLAVWAELAVQHCPGVSQQSGQDLPTGHLQNLGVREGG